MKYIVEYKLHGNISPYFIADGGYFEINNHFIGITKESSSSHIPKLVSDGGDLLSLTNQDVIDRIVSLVVIDENDNILNDSEKEILANNWLISKGF